MLKVFISVPMNGRTDIEIRYDISKAMDEINKITNINGIIYVDNYIMGATETNPLKLFAKAIDKMAEADAVYFCPGWHKARGCKMEYILANAYDKKILNDFRKEEI